MTTENKFYQDVLEFTINWLNKKNVEGKKPLLSEIIGGFEIAKNEIYFTQAWFTKKLVTKEIKAQMTHIIAALDGKEISIGSDGSITIVQVKD